jgi:hypothetical protein
VIWVIGFPVLTLWKLYKERKHLDKEDNIIKYGLFYIGLSDENYYWELVVNNLRKIVVIIVSISV